MSYNTESIKQAATVPGSQSPAKHSNKPSMGKEDFLTLLVAQLENQDPLKPDDATEFTAQLAQFSSLEQLVSLNSSMDSFVAANRQTDRLATLNTIGKKVAYQTSTFQYSSGSVEIGYKLDAGATDVTLVLRHNNTTVAEFDGRELGPGNHFITWDGLDNSGTQAKAGSYKITVRTKGTTEEEINSVPLVKTIVTGVDMDNENGTVLITAAGSIDFKSILGVYEPDDSENQKSQSNLRLRDATTTINETLNNVADIKNNVDKIIH